MIAIVLPSYNEEKGILTLLNQLDKILETIPQKFLIILVDDASTDNTINIVRDFQFAGSNIEFNILKMKFNVGHQSAIYNGLRHAIDTDSQNIIVMDSDGEDDPNALPLLVLKNQFDIVEVKRGRRKESIAFQVMYLFYKLIFKFITGKEMNFGNYTMVKKEVLEQLKFNSFIHYPAFLLKQNGTRSSIKFDRAKRINGFSKMGWHGLFFHSFKSLVEFGEQLLMLFLKLFLILSIFIGLFIINVLYKKIIGEAILGWTSTVLIGLFSLAIICLGFFIIGILFLQLINKSQSNSSEGMFIRIK